MDVKETGIRYDKDKLDWSLVPMHFLERMVLVLMFGAQKYGKHNWRKGLHYSRITSSLQRHLNAFVRGEDVDVESGLPHSAHILCNALFLAGMEEEHPEMDDRISSAPKHRTKEQAALPHGDRLVQSNLFPKEELSEEYEQLGPGDIWIGKEGRVRVPRGFMIEFRPGYNPNQREFIDIVFKRRRTP